LTDDPRAGKPGGDLARHVRRSSSCTRPCSLVPCSRSRRRPGLSTRRQAGWTCWTS